MSRALATGLAMAGIAAAAAFGLRLTYLAGHQAGADGVRAEIAAAAVTASADAAETARLQRRGQAAAAERIDTDALQKTRAAAAAADGRRTVGDGLRLALAARRGGDQPAASGADAGQCTAERAYADQLARLLDEGSRLAEEGAAIVDAAVIRVDGLQAREQQHQARP